MAQPENPFNILSETAGLAIGIQQHLAGELALATGPKAPDLDLDHQYRDAIKGYFKHLFGIITSPPFVQILGAELNERASFAQITHTPQPLGSFRSDLSDMSLIILQRETSRPPNLILSFDLEVGHPLDNEDPNSFKEKGVNRLISTAQRKHYPFNATINAPWKYDVGSRYLDTVKDRVRADLVITPDLLAVTPPLVLPIVKGINNRLNNLQEFLNGEMNKAAQDQQLLKRYTQAALSATEIMMQVEKPTNQK